MVILVKKEAAKHYDWIIFKLTFSISSSVSISFAFKTEKMYKPIMLQFIPDVLFFLWYGSAAFFHYFFPSYIKKWTEWTVEGIVMANLDNPNDLDSSLAIHRYVS